jgi:hypothetical protein
MGRVRVFMEKKTRKKRCITFHQPYEHYGRRRFTAVKVMNRDVNERRGIS